MLFYYLAYFLLFVVQAYEHENIISISAVLGARVLFDTEAFDQFSEYEDSTTIIWSKGFAHRKVLISSSSRFSVINATKLLITHTLIGDEGFYTLEIQADENPSIEYLFHVSWIQLNRSDFYLPGHPIFPKSLHCPFSFITPLSSRTIHQYHLFRLLSC